MRTTGPVTAIACCLVLAPLAGAAAQSAPPEESTVRSPVAAAAERRLTLELNNMQSLEGVCRVSFVATNAMGVELETASYEMVVFDQDQLVDQILLLEFGRLPEGKTRVVQFDLESPSCERFSRILVNDARACEGPGLEVEDCLDSLTVSSRQSVEFGL